MPLIEDLYAKQRARQAELIPFFYSTQFTTVAPSAAPAQNINVNSDSHFVVRYVNCTCYSSAPIAVFTGLAALTIGFLDTGSGRTLQDAQQAIQNITGGTGGTIGGSGGNQPFIFPEPWLIKAGSSVTVSITNLSTTVGFGRIDVSLIGFKVFRFGTNSPFDFQQ